MQRILTTNELAVVNLCKTYLMRELLIHNAYSKYLHNINGDKHALSDSYFYRGIAISSAFSWFESAEGCEFWHKMSDIFQKMNARIKNKDYIKRPNKMLFYHYFTQLFT